jgi:hypothetical protein
MNQSRVHSLASVWMGIGLIACATEIGDGAIGPPTDDADPGPYEPTRGPVASVSAAQTQTPTRYLWTDSIQTSDRAPYGFSQIKLERPIGRDVAGNNEVNLTRYRNSYGAYSLKHVATFDSNGGSRSQAGIYSFANKAFDQQVKKPEGIWIAQQWYFPAAISAGNQVDTPPWVNLWDFHSVGSGGGSRWDTQPGLMLAEDGSMRIRWAWHYENTDSDWSPIRLPVGRWFDIEMHYVWSSSATVSLWIDGVLALEQRGVRTRGSGHDSVETYMKFYGSAISGPVWRPLPSVKYMRNVRMADRRIWR